MSISSKHHWVLGVLGITLACSRTASDQRTVEEAPLAPAANGAIVVMRNPLPNEPQTGTVCSTAPCVSGKCRVICPKATEMFHVDIQALVGHMVIIVDGVTAVDVHVPVITTTGLALQVDVRPPQWPVPIEVRVNDLSGSVKVERATPFVAASATKEHNRIQFFQQAEPYHYD